MVEVVQWTKYRSLAGVTARGGAVRGLGGRQDFRPSLPSQQHSFVHASAHLQADPHRGYVRETFASRTHVYKWLVNNRQVC